jgi:hypothetical protein
VGNALLVGAPKTDVAIQSVTVLGNASYGDILAGYSTNTNGGADPLGTGVNANAQIGTVTIGGNLMGTNIIAGVAPGTNGYFGTASSAALSGAGVADLPSLISTISKIIITGNVLATPNTSDSYGIAAQYIKSATVGGAVLPLVSGADNDTFAAGKEQRLPSANGDEYLYEV